MFKFWYVTDNELYKKKPDEINDEEKDKSLLQNYLEIDNLDLSKFDDSDLIKMESKSGKNHDHKFLSYIKDKSLLQNYFYELNEDALTDIVNTHSLSDEIRNLAFNSGCSIENITRPTPYITNELFYITLSACENYIENKNTDQNAQLPKHCKDILERLFLNNNLTSQHQNDFVKTLKGKSILPREISSLYETAILYITDANLIKYILENTEYLIEDSMVFNTCLNLKTREEFLPKIIDKYISIIKGLSIVTTKAHDYSVTLLSNIASSPEFHLSENQQLELYSCNNDKINKSLSCNPNTCKNVLEKLRFSSEKNLDIIFNSTLCLSYKNIKTDKSNVGNIIRDLCHLTNKNEYDGTTWGGNWMYEPLVKNIFYKCSHSEKMDLYKIFKYQKKLVSNENDALNFMIDKRIRVLKSTLLKT